MEILKDNMMIFIFGVISIIPMVFTMIFNISLPGYVYNVLKISSVQFVFQICYMALEDYVQV